MATKQQAMKALQAHAPGATLDDESIPGSEYIVQLEAPRGCYWEGQEHCLPVLTPDQGNKSEFWQEVIDQIKTLPHAVSCYSELKCESVARYGNCEYWE